MSLSTARYLAIVIAVLYVPAAPNGSLVLAFHGGGQTATQLQRLTGFDALANREHFIVAYVEAFERSWADGRNETSAEKHRRVVRACRLRSSPFRGEPIRQCLSTGTSTCRAAVQRGVSSQNLNASEVIWAFFSTHAR